MMADACLYVDTSVLVKRCVQEPQSDAASRATPGYAIVTSALAPLEALSAIRRTAKSRPSDNLPHR
jgi:predicted nucleic acid-binding protein